MTETEHYIVNPISLRNCRVSSGDKKFNLLDLSLVAFTVPLDPFLGSPGEKNTFVFQLENRNFTVSAKLQKVENDLAYFEFDGIVPSCSAQLRAFLSPKKVGESIFEKEPSAQGRHFRGLNESEMWSDDSGGILFTYLDNQDVKYQFLLRARESRGPLTLGRIRRDEFKKLQGHHKEDSLIGLEGAEVYTKVSECRDIITNFRPTAHFDFGLKQKLLKLLSDYLYSSHYRRHIIQPLSSRNLTASSGE
jgi:hypothetical protein